jgi:predicted RNA-binding protein YlqC (UPF0109 family)
MVEYALIFAFLNNQNAFMKDFIAYLIKNLVDKPDAVDIQVVDGENGTLVEIRVSPEDIAKVVGRQGRTIKSLRTIAMTVGARFGRRVRLEVIHQ